MFFNEFLKKKYVETTYLKQKKRSFQSLEIFVRLIIPLKAIRVKVNCEGIVNGNIHLTNECIVQPGRENYPQNNLQSHQKSNNCLMNVFYCLVSCRWFNSSRWSKSIQNVKIEIKTIYPRGKGSTQELYSSLRRTAVVPLLKNCMQFFWSG